MVSGLKQFCAKISEGGFAGTNMLAVCLNYHGESIDGKARKSTTEYLRPLTRLMLAPILGLSLLRYQILLYYTIAPSDAIDAL